MCRYRRFLALVFSVVILWISVGCGNDNDSSEYFYEKGLSAYNAGDYELAYSYFKVIPEYEDSEIFIDSILAKVEIDKPQTTFTTQVRTPTASITTNPALTSQSSSSAAVTDPILTSVPTSALTAASTNPVVTATTVADAVSAGMLNAVRKAKEYLNFTSFSHDGLVGQLEYEKFTRDEAIYGADNCGADWNAQAAKKAEEYLSFTSFSHDGLVGQLEYEKFTHDQAVYGADSCGANWNEQAAKKAKEYLSFSSFSRDGLIEQLEYEKFTYEQSVYGVDNCGVNWG